MNLQLRVGVQSQAGKRPYNEDFADYALPGAQTASKGICLALADGISVNHGPSFAAQLTIRSVLSDYYATPETWEVFKSLDRVVNAINRWLRAQLSGAYGGYATTLSLLVLRGRHYYAAHVGDSRIYHWRDGRLAQLTTDHVWNAPGMQHVLRRAVGLDENILLDFHDDRLEAGDVFLMASDGLWEVLGDAGLAAILGRSMAPQETAEALVAAALAKSGEDNATAMVIAIDGLPDETWQSRQSDRQDLPVPPRLSSGQQLDGLEVIRPLSGGHASRLYLVREPATGRLLVLKTLSQQTQSQPLAREALLMEEWLGRRLASHYFPQLVPLEHRQYLYFLQTWHEGATLHALLAAGQYFTALEAVQIGIRLSRGVAALHRLNIVHRDIKPENVHIAHDDKLRILDLGAAYSAVVSPDALAALAGTPSYLAPELLAGGAPNAQSDLYAVGVTLYYLLTRHYPYGEIEAFQQPRFQQPTPPTRYRPDIPAWLEAVLLKTVQADPRQRFETSEELRLQLEKGEQQPVVRQRTALYGRAPVTLWQGMTLVMLLINIDLICLLVV